MDDKREQGSIQSRLGRALYFACTGLLLSILVSCACGPVR